MNPIAVLARTKWAQTSVALHHAVGVLARVVHESDCCLTGPGRSRLSLFGLNNVSLLTFYRSKYFPFLMTRRKLNNFNNEGLSLVEHCSIFLKLDCQLSVTCDILKIEDEMNKSVSCRVYKYFIM